MQLLVGTMAPDTLHYFSLADPDGEEPGRFRLEASHVLRSYPHHAAFSSDREQFAIDLEGHTGRSPCHVYDFGGANDILHGASDYAKLRFTADGQHVVGISWDQLLVWRIEGGGLVYSSVAPRDLPADKGKQRYAFVRGTDRPILVRTDKNGRFPTILIVEGSRPKVVSRAGLPAGKYLIWFMERQDPVALLQTPSGYSVVSGITGKQLRVLRAPSDLASSLESEHVATANVSGSLLGYRSPDKKRLRLLSLTTGKEQVPVVVQDGVVAQEWAFMPGGRVASIPVGDAVRFYALETAKLLLTLRPDLEEPQNARRPARWMAWTPDGRFTGSDHCEKLYLPPGLRLTRDDAGVSRLLWENLAAPAGNNP
jgi:hypothetical protein